MAEVKCGVTKERKGGGRAAKNLMTSALSDSTVTDSGKREKVGDTENSELVSRGNEFVKCTKRF